mmetsp:Transcript_6353/g.13365  ORF Transcript_6353/g.13365 Transcript_6353/m.13365 type:complete len:86 (+) Transcript_6353:1297-1554(+)
MIRSCHAVVALLERQIASVDRSGFAMNKYPVPICINLDCVASDKSNTLAAIMNTMAVMDTFIDVKIRRQLWIMSIERFKVDGKRP